MFYVIVKFYVVLNSVIIVGFSFLKKSLLMYIFYIITFSHPFNFPQEISCFKLSEF